MIAKEHKPILAFSAGAASAILFLILSRGEFLGFFLGYFTPLPLLMAGLGLGIDAALWSGGIATLLVFLITSILASGTVDPVMDAWLYFAFFFVLPVVVVTKKALAPGGVITGLIARERPGIRKPKKNHPNRVAERIVSGLCFYLCGILGLVWLAVGNSEGSLITMIETAFRETLQKIAPASGDHTLESLLDIVPFAPGLFALSWFMIICINTGIGQSLLQQRGLNMCPTPILNHFRPPTGLMILATGFTAVLASGELALLALNLTIILAIPYCLTGLAVTHWAVKRYHMSPVFLYAVYATLFFVPVLILVVVFVGVIDQAVDIRRLRTPVSNQENI